MFTLIKKRKLAFFLLATLALLLPFQNCSKNPSVFEDSVVQKTMDFFEYRYSEPAEIYFELQIVPDADIPNDPNRMYNLLGLATYADGSTGIIEYEVEVFGTSKQSICSLKAGTLAVGDTLFQETCLLSKQTVIGDAVIKVRRPGGNWHVYTKSYQN
ncbi:hypothetical protein [Pseudobdellovibrio exovorus]|uniref:Lipoprotein n=1 Tax=Pseudobdellovibrio exovorus JSS TaxID=1184267 RepID=M4V8H9_9BACT|nr:hypothetical protein [Pseudobdellovibrio exovorus]AGH95493.1 hypothetical protein A11Q_1277 [Pseudobdellovibrio exovorus JSS]